jgi:predicted permease
VTVPALRSLRTLRKHWTLAAIALFSLSLAMALGVISLSLSNTFLLLPPSAPQPDRLVSIASRSATEPAGQISYPDYVYFRDHNDVFTGVAAAPNSISVNEEINEHGEIKVMIRPVSGNYFDVMAIQPFMGRLLAPGDEGPKATVAVMTYSCWKHLGSDPGILNRKIAGFSIVGVAPPSFTGSFYGINGDLLVPLSNSSYLAIWREQREARHLTLLARLKPGVTLRAAQTEITALAAQLASAYPEADKNRGAAVARATLLPPDSVRTGQMVLGILVLVVILVLLIACANVANLLLAIAVGRRQESTIKLALGSSRARLVWEFLVESALLCASAAAIGYAVAAALIRRYSEISFHFPIVGSFAFGLNLHLDARVAALTLSLICIAILATGLAPALYASSPHLAEILSGENVVGGRRKQARRNILVIVQVALCTLVLAGMGLCQRSLYNLRHVNPGFSARNLVAVQVSPNQVSPNEDQNSVSEARGREFYRDVIDTARQLPGLESVCLANDLPLLGTSPAILQLSKTSDKVPVSSAIVDPAYFETFGIRLASGRLFTNHDGEANPEVAVINRKMAQKFWPNQDPVGQTILAADSPRRIQVIGVVADGKYLDLDEDPREFIYFSTVQHYQASIYLVARTTSDPRAAIVPLAQMLHKLGQRFVVEPFTFDEWINISLFTQRVVAGSVAGLSALALLLAVIGLFGAISYSVSERRKEIGIRVALGAGRRQLLGMILRQTLLVAGTGVAAGAILGFAATLVLRSQLYGIAAGEWIVLVPVSVAMLALSVAVACISANPWLSVDPLEAVRHA